ELVGPFHDKARPAFAAVPLGFDPSSLSAVANDFGYEQVFARQLQALGRRGLYSVLFSNHDGGAARRWADVFLYTPRASTPRVQELHLAYGHWLCESIEIRLGGSRTSSAKRRSSHARP